MKKKLLNRSKSFRFRQFKRASYSVFNSIHKAVTIGVITTAMLTFAHSTEVSAQTASDSDSTKIAEKELDEVTVTSSRVELPINQTARLITVITKEEVQRAPVQSIQDLLSYYANIDVLQRGGHGVQADISIRGGSFDQTAILLNGINLSNPQTGHYSFDIPVNLSDIERIEIVHGPSSVMYGASAFSGAINIITRKQPEHKAYFKLEGGSHALLNTEAHGVLSNSIMTNQLSAGYSRSDGYIANSDYDILNLLWQTHIKAHHKTNIDIQLGYNDKKYGANTFYSAAYPNQYDKTKSYYTSVKAETGDKLKFIPTIYWNRHYDCFQLIKNDPSTVPFNYHRTDVYGSNLNFQYTSVLGITSFGTEFRNEGIVSTKLGKPMEQPDGKYTKEDNRTSISYALEHNVIYKRGTISASILANNNTSLKEGYKFYPAINASYRITDNLKAYASWNKAMRMPTFTDLYYNTTTHSGNASLKYEKSDAIELGFKFRNHLIQANIASFYMEGKNLIDWIWVDDQESVLKGKWHSQNLANVYKKGIEIDATLFLSELSTIFDPSTTLKIGYSRIDQSGRNVSGQLESTYILNYLRDKFVTQINIPIYQGISLNGSFRWQNRMGFFMKYESADNKIKTPYPSFSTLDLKLNWKINDLQFNLSANNVYDTYFYDLGNIPQAGFWLSGGFRYTIR